MTLDPSDHPRGQPHLSSASGLARVGRKLYIAADDEHHLVQLDADDPVACPLRMVQFAPGALPDDHAQRKKAKPDLEVLVHVPPLTAQQNGLLAAFGSASTPRRQRAFVFPVDRHGELVGLPRTVSLEQLHAALHGRLGEPNFEAAFFDGTHLHLFQRAHRGHPYNAHIRYQGAPAARWLAGTGTVPPPLDIATVDLGSIDGVPLGITDAAAWPAGGWVFSAVAEDTSNPYDDGACVGSVIGWCDARNRVVRCERLKDAPKVEGVVLADDDRLWLVTDADDPARPSELLELRLSALS
ncbi:hypothetical protein M8A51_10925 [Schlegelella sp. S2-27]|uniref:Phytase-like domain-containing protein n=1 Tax=Caldimonas mangrovi TaxID=2944811 RepID=A0ABT0YMT8_9BURK|nr:hypothetical protein [Caldimonas mangrovi]MCM5680046.1 hypothetical protein [Caldimonas mangrovi]